MRDITLQELLEAGCHFGHQVRRWNPSMKKYIYGERDGIHILDLAQSKTGLVEAGEYLRDLAAEGRVILFVGTKRQAAEVVKAEAIRAGMPYMTKRWVGGLLTNFEQLSRRIRKMQEMMTARGAGEYKKYTKREQLLLDREIGQLQKFFAGVDGMEKLPDALFVVDSHKEEVAVREAVRMKIPVVAMVDTNGDATMVDKLIPVNDDAEKSIELIVKYIGDAVVEGKTSNDKIQNSTQTQNSNDQKPVVKKKAVKKVKKEEDGAGKN